MAGICNHNYFRLEFNMKRLLSTALLIAIIITSTQSLLYAGEPGVRIKNLISSLDDPDVQVRQAAIKALGDSKDPAAVGPLLAICNSNNTTRSLAYRALVKIAHPDAFDTFADAVRDEDQYIPTYAIAGLVALKNPKAVHALALALGNNGSHISSPAASALITFGDDSVGVLEKSLSLGPQVRRLAANALIKINTPASLKALTIPATDTDWRKKLSIARTSANLLRSESPDMNLVEILLGFYSPDTNEILRVEVIKTLSSIWIIQKNNKMLDVLIKVLAEDSSEAVRCAALKGLYPQSNYQDKDNARIKTALISVLDDKSIAVKRLAINSLISTRDKTLIKPFCRFLTSEDVHIRRGASGALTHIADKTALKALTLAIDDVDVDVRRNVSKALVLIDDDGVIEPLGRMLSDKDEKVVREILSYFKKSKNPKAIDSIITELDRGRHEHTGRMISILGTSGSDKAVIALRKVVSTSNTHVKTQAINALVEAKAKSAEGDIINLLDDDNLQVRRSAVMALGKLGGKASALTLGKELVKVTNVSFATDILDSLRSIAAEESVEYVIEFLKTNSKVLPRSIRERDKVRSKAIGVLSSLRDPRSMEVLIAEIEDKSSKLHSSAIRALSNIKGDKPVTYLLKLAKQTESPGDAGEATERLIDRSDKSTLEFLISICEGKNYQARYAVARIDPVKGMKYFITPRPHERVYGENPLHKALKATGEKDLVLALIETIKSSDRSIIFMSTNLLGKVGDLRAVEPLEKLYEKDKNNYRNALRAKERIIKFRDKWK